MRFDGTSPVSEATVAATGLFEESVVVAVVAGVVVVPLSAVAFPFIVPGFVSSLWEDWSVGCKNGLSKTSTFYFLS